MWPASLPDPEWDTIRPGAAEGNVLRTAMDAGPAKQRPRTTAAPRPYPLAFSPVTDAALDEFEAFYEVDLGQGALAFDMPHPVTGQTASFRFVQDGQPYSAVPIGNDANRLTVNLELLP